MAEERQRDDIRAGSLVGRPYREAVEALWGRGRTRIWDYARYDGDGDLWINSLRVADAIEAYGTPLEIVDTQIVQRRSVEWMDLCRRVAAERAYPGRLHFLYAAKANMASEVVHAAYRAGWHAETSSTQDLSHLRWMRDHGLLPAGLRVVCNGFKPAPERHRLPRRPEAVPEAPGPRSQPDAGLDLPPATRELSDVHTRPYAAQIVEMASDGWDICPILDQGEIEYFQRPGTPSMDVGLRLKFGRVSDEAGLGRLVSRFGMDWPELDRTASALDRSSHLRFTTLHAMVGAATSIPVGDMVASFGLAARFWADLRTRHPALRELNIGGGVPPLGEDYDHPALLAGLFDHCAAAARAAGTPPPEITFEFGSLVAAEAGFHVFSILDLKHNDTSGPPWAIVDGGLMAAIPDMLLIDKPFRILAVGGADRPARAVRLGDVTCDSDGRYPPESFGSEAIVLLPDGPPPAIAIVGIGAYQEILSGVRGAHHCGLLEALELIVEAGADGRPTARLMPRQTPGEAAALLGYSEAAVEPLRRALEGQGQGQGQG